MRAASWNIDKIDKQKCLILLGFFLIKLNGVNH